MFRLIRLDRAVPMLTRLQIDEALFRNTSDNWLVLSHGVVRPTIVMGISGVATKLITANAVDNNVPVIKRFTGGGTVVLDEDSLLVSFIGSAAWACGDVALYPRDIMRWNVDFYARALGQSAFQLRDHDFVYESKKVGGNAQAISKDRSEVCLHR